MIITKDGLTRVQIIELLRYSARPGCQYLMAVNPEGRTTREYQEESVVRILRAEEKPFIEERTSGSAKYSFRFTVKVLVEDKYWELSTKDNKWYKSGKVPTETHKDVNLILNK